MADKSNGWGNLISQGGVANYPLMGLLAGTYAKGHAYQSQLTPYKREAKGDWARALDESLNQYFSQLPGYYQQVRANKLQQQQLAQQKIKQGQEQQMFDLKMQEVERVKQARKNWPKSVASLPLSDSAKKYLTSQGYDRGAPLLNSMMTEHYKSQAKGKTRLLTEDELKKHKAPKLTQVNEGTGKLIFPEKHVLEATHTTPSASPWDSFSKARGLKPRNDNSPENTQAWKQIGGPSDFLQYLGSKPSEYQQRAFITNYFPEWHPVWKENQAHILSKRANVTQNGTVTFIEPIGQAKGPPPKAPVSYSLKVPRMPPGKELTLTKIIQEYANKGIRLDPNAIIGLNADYFPTRNPSLMLTTEEVGKPLVIVPTNTKLDVAQADDVAKGGVKNEYIVPIKDGFQVKIIPPVVSPWEQEKDINQRHIKNVRATESAREFRFLAGLGDELSTLPVGRIKGLTEALSWRIIADIQKEREFGVLSPSEITTIKKSVPNPNDWINYLLYSYDGEKGRQYIQASMDAYLEELDGTKRAIEAELGGMKARGMQANIWDYQPVDWTAKYDPKLFEQSAGYEGPITPTSQPSKDPLEQRNKWALDILKSLAD